MLLDWIEHGRFCHLERVFSLKGWLLMLSEYVIEIEFLIRCHCHLRLVLALLTRFRSLVKQILGTVGLLSLSVWEPHRHPLTLDGRVGVVKVIVVS